MSVSVDPSQPPLRPVEIAPAISSFDRVAALLISLLILFGTAVGAMFMILTTTRPTRVEQVAPIAFIDDGPGGRGDHEAGTGRDKYNAQVEEIDEFFPPQIDDSVQAVTTVISADAVAFDMPFEGANFSSGRAGRGDSRRAGPLGEGNGTADIVPRWERWQVRFASADIDAYAKQLDAFGIELAAMGGGQDQVDYAANLAQPSPTRRSGASEAEKRLYMTWRAGELIEADKQLLSRAGIITARRVILQFYPPQTEARLAALEQEQAGARNLKEIKRTVFGVRNNGGKYELFVISQEYRFAP